MSASPVFTISARESTSGTLRITTFFTFGFLRQYLSKASSTSSIPGVVLTNL